VCANEQAYDWDLAKITEESLNLPKVIVEITEAIAGASPASTKNIAYMKGISYTKCFSIFQNLKMLPFSLSKISSVMAKLNLISRNP